MTWNRSNYLRNVVNKVFFLRWCFVIQGWWWWERVVVGVWMLVTLVLTKSYAGNLMSQLAVRYVPQPIQTLEDVRDSTLTILIAEGTSDEQAFKTTTSGIYREIWELQEVNRMDLIYARDLPRMADLVRGGDIVHVNMDVYFKMDMSRQFSKVMQVAEAGIYEYWHHVFYPNSSSCLHAPTKFAINSYLRIKNIWGMFVILAGGCVAGLGALFSRLHL